MRKCPAFLLPIINLFTRPFGFIYVRQQTYFYNNREHNLEIAYRVAEAHNAGLPR